MLSLWKSTPFKGGSEAPRILPLSLRFYALVALVLCNARELLKMNANIASPSKSPQYGTELFHSFSFLSPQVSQKAQIVAGRRRGSERQR